MRYSTVKHLLPISFLSFANWPFINSLRSFCRKTILCVISLNLWITICPTLLLLCRVIPLGMHALQWLSLRFLSAVLIFLLFFKSFPVCMHKAHADSSLTISPLEMLDVEGMNSGQRLGWGGPHFSSELEFQVFSIACAPPQFSTMERGCICPRFSVLSSRVTAYSPFTPPHLPWSPLLGGQSPDKRNCPSPWFLHHAHLPFHSSSIGPAQQCLHTFLDTPSSLLVSPTTFL